MPAAAVLREEEDDALWLWRPWAHLPLDLLRNISRRLHATTDFVRFHATCKPWRDTLPPPACYPAFLPWLLAPPDSTTKHWKARCVFSSSKSARRGTAATTEISVPDWRWVISTVDGTAVSTLSTAGVAANVLTGPAASASATPLPPFSCDEETKFWVDRANGIVSGDGTIFLCVIGQVRRSKLYYIWPFNAALLRPGDAAWIMVRKQCFRLDNCSCIAYHDGKIVIRSSYRDLFCIETTQDHHPRWDTKSPSENGKPLQASYLLESRGELLLVNVVVNDRPHDDYCTIDSYADGLSVSVHALQEAEGGKRQWVKRDGQSFADRVMFLGRPISFAVNATRFGAMSDGCAYFVIEKGAIWSKMVTNRCRVFKYMFKDDRSELIEQLPAQWREGYACMWLTPPQPSIASTEEIRERLEPSHRELRLQLQEDHDSGQISGFTG